MRPNPTVARLNGASYALRLTQIAPERRMSTEWEGRHSLLCHQSEFDLDIGRVGYGRRMHRRELARSAQP